MEKRIKFYNPILGDWIDIAFDVRLFNKIIAASLKGFEVQHLTTYSRRL